MQERDIERRQQEVEKEMSSRSLVIPFPLTFAPSIVKLFVRFPQLLSGLESCFACFVTTTLGFFVLSPPRSKEYSG